MSTRKFTARERRQMVHALRLARGRIECRTNTFICLTLDSLVVQSEIQQRTADLLQEMIMGRIHPYGSLGSWVAANVGLKPAKFGGKAAFAEDIRKHRIKWLDLLIEEFSDLAKMVHDAKTPSELLPLIANLHRWPMGFFRSELRIAMTRRLAELSAQRKTAPAGTAKTTPQ